MNRDDRVRPWWELGACRDLTLAEVDRVFFPGGKPGSHPKHLDDEAKAYCAVCPVVAECLRYAVEGEILVGTFGGMTELERRRKFHGGKRMAGGRIRGGRIA